MSFSELSIHPLLAEALEGKGYIEATPVQALVSKSEHQGRDLLVSARTGSGKTIAFGLVLSDSLLDGDALPPASSPLALVVAPTRELALQVQRELSWLYAGAGVKVISCVGGMDIRKEQRALAQGAHLVVGTPGRLVDHLERKKLRLDRLKAVVLDEADEMLDMGFREELERILQDAPKERRTLLFSATLPRAIEQLAERYQNAPLRLAADSPQKAHADIEYRAHLIAMREREHAVVNILRGVDAPSAIVFCQTRDGVSRLHGALVERGFDAVALSGELSQAERNRALSALRGGRARVLVATDVAARGLDLPAVGLVIHADLPNDPAVLAHRSGRTGRAGNKGVSVLLSPASRRRLAERLLRTNGIRVEWSEIPTPEEIREKDAQHFQAEMERMALELSDEDLEAAQAFASRLEPVQLAALLLRQYRDAKPAPEDLPLSSGLASESATRGSRQSRVERRGDRRDGGRERFEKNFGPNRSRSDSEENRSSAFASRREPRQERADRRSERGTGDSVWFQVNVGRERNADPRWLLPMLCRRGRVEREDIGSIRIFPEETHVEVSARVAANFEAASSKPDPKDRSLRISRLGRGDTKSPVSKAASFRETERRSQSRYRDPEAPAASVGGASSEKLQSAGSKRMGPGSSKRSGPLILDDILEQIDEESASSSGDESSYIPSSAAGRPESEVRGKDSRRRAPVGTDAFGPENRKKGFNADSPTSKTSGSRRSAPRDGSFERDGRRDGGSNPFERRLPPSMRKKGSASRASDKGFEGRDSRGASRSWAQAESSGGGRLPWSKEGRRTGGAGAASSKGRSGAAFRAWEQGKKASFSPDRATFSEASADGGNRSPRRYSAGGGPGKKGMKR